jgi:hypothetical protein
MCLAAAAMSWNDSGIRVVRRQMAHLIGSLQGESELRPAS